MLYRPLGESGVSLSVIALGGHEYLADGKSRGFNEDFQAAVKPGYQGTGYGGPKRLALLKMAYESGINLYDVTIDPEKEALGRNLQEMPPPFEVYVQTRPEGMGYGYDPANRKMARYDLLQAEVVRILRLLRRDCIDILNLPFMQDALDADPEYLNEMCDNIARLKQEGLIRFASADTFSGEGTYLAQIGAGCFDSVDMNLNFVDTGPIQRVIPGAVEAGMSVVSREVFIKGALFAMGREAGVADTNLLARLSLKWNLAVPGVTSVLVGADQQEHLVNALSVLASLDATGEEQAVLDLLERTKLYTTTHADRLAKFTGSSGA